VLQQVESAASPTTAAWEIDGLAPLSNTKHNDSMHLRRCCIPRQRGGCRTAISRPCTRMRTRQPRVELVKAFTAWSSASSPSPLFQPGLHITPLFSGSHGHICRKTSYLLRPRNFWRVSLLKCRWQRTTTSRGSPAHIPRGWGEDWTGSSFRPTQQYPDSRDSRALEGLGMPGLFIDRYRETKDAQQHQA
jgi:hypothetical protein